MIDVKKIKRFIHSMRMKRWEQQKHNEIVSWAKAFNNGKQRKSAGNHQIEQITFVCEEFFGSMPFCVERPCLISLMPG